MVLGQLVYISQPTSEIQEAVSEFMPVAREKNKEYGISGLIIVDNNFYLQVIEGGRENINQLYGNIVRDKRHKFCTLLRYIQIKTKDFPSWDMIHTTLPELNDSYFDSIDSLEDITYNKLTSTRAMSLLRRVSANLQYQEKNNF
jgi:hypothetical protein